LQIVGLKSVRKCGYQQYYEKYVVACLVGAIRLVGVAQEQEKRSKFWPRRQVSSPALLFFSHTLLLFWNVYWLVLQPDVAGEAPNGCLPPSFLTSA
jgi:hypothetical protein